MERNEQLRSAEILETRQTERASSVAVLTPAQVEKAFAQRKEMLAEISSDISPVFSEALTQKIQHERQVLNSFIERDTQVIEAKKRSAKVLDSTFFVQKPLDTTHF